PQWSADGSQLFFVSNREGQRDVYVVGVGTDGRPRGRPARVTTGLNVQSFTFEREGKRLADAVYREEANVWSLPVPALGTAPATIEHATQLTSGSQIVEATSVSPDGRWILFDSNVAGTADIYRMPVAGGEPERLTNGAGGEYYASVSPDGSEFTFQSLRNGHR